MVKTTPVVPDYTGWAEAIATYEKATEDLKKPFREEFEEIISFATGPDWKRILRLLKAADETILIGCDDIECTNPNYFLGQEGFFIKTATDCEETRTILLFDCKLNKEESASQIARAFRHKMKLVSFKDFVYAELNRIASEAFQVKK